MADRAAAAVALDAGDPDVAADRALASAAAADEVGVPVEAAALADARGPRTRPSRPTRARRRRAAARRRRASRLRCAQISSRRRARAATARPSHPPPHAARQGRRSRRRVADLARASGRAARRRPQDEPGDRRSTLPQPEDGRDAHPQHVPQARRFLTRRARTRRRARRLPRRSRPDRKSRTGPGCDREPARRDHWPGI